MAAMTQVRMQMDSDIPSTALPPLSPPDSKWTVQMVSDIPFTALPPLSPPDSDEAVLLDFALNFESRRS